MKKIIKSIDDMYIKKKDRNYKKNCGRKIQKVIDIHARKGMTRIQQSLRAINGGTRKIHISHIICPSWINCWIMPVDEFNIFIILISWTIINRHVRSQLKRDRHFFSCKLASSLLSLIIFYKFFSFVQEKRLSILFKLAIFIVRYTIFIFIFFFLIQYEYLNSWQRLWNLMR